jgi:structural maintenance of chromosome 4
MKSSTSSGQDSNANGLTASEAPAGTPTTRLMITKMVLENFKSYAGVQEIGPFHKRFSSIVGPNGSGKSNVIDALLFVFGKRAKQLRLNKVSELIHKSSNYTNLEYAKVEIYFQLILDDENSEDAFEVIPRSEFIVTRIAYQNNQSKYFINAKNSTYSEIGILLRQHGIDLDNNRFLILQGEVEQIAMMKPKAQSPHEDGLLEYLEEIIGSNRYVSQIEESLKSVEQLNEVRVEKVKRLQIAQSDRESLERPRTEAVAYLEREANIRHKNNLLYQLYLHDCDVNIEALSTKLQGYQDRLKEEKQRLVETEKELKTLDKSYQQILGEYEKLTTEMQKTADVSPPPP